ncbi:hypothetical protein GCM10009830_13000 [Glycomyces endophyticus]|uniref:DUF4367 domain-containing protein n=1 Tax=Glycomyces endophyticus TaxID=480996 RepID=A0ABP4S7G8_9ACTN
MNLQDDPGALFRDRMPDLTPPPAAFDLDAIVRDGYRARRRHRAVLTGASATSVAAIAAVLAFSAGVLPGDRTDPADPAHPTDPAGEATTGAPPGSTEIDYANAGYPWPGDSGFGDQAVADQLTAAGRDAFDDLLIATGRFEASDFQSIMNDPSEEEIAQYAEDMQLSLEEAEAELSYVEDDGLFVFTGHTSPGNYGQVQLYSYEATALAAQEPEAEDWNRHLLEVEALLPGGWTAEPGPTSEQFFPQHLIEDTGSLETRELDDGRTLYTAVDDCETTLAVTYPNAAGLRATWDTGCDGEEEVPVDAAAFEAAVLAMPQIDYDTGGLAEVGQVVDVPTGWLASDLAWEEWAEEGAQATGQLVEAALSEIASGSMLGSASALVSDDWEYLDPDAVRLHQYTVSGTLPYSTTIDTTVDDASFDLTYTLPGGWLPGFSGEDQNGPYLANCRADFECREAEVGGRTAYIAERRDAHEPDAGSGSTEGWFEGEYEITVVDPDGWAVSVWMAFGNDDFELSADEVADILAQLPAPEYDAELEPVLAD